MGVLVKLSVLQLQNSHLLFYFNSVHFIFMAESRGILPFYPLDLVMDLPTQKFTLEDKRIPDC